MRRARGRLRAGGLSFPSSLRWRLTAWVAAVMLVSVVVIFYVVYRDTGTELRAQIDRDVAGDTGQLAQTLRPHAGQSATQIAATMRRYVQAQPYVSTSTLLFVLVPGASAAFNHPEIVAGPILDDGETAAQQAVEHQSARRLLVPDLGYTDLAVPDIGSMRILERAVRVDR